HADRYIPLSYLPPPASSVFLLLMHRYCCFPYTGPSAIYTLSLHDALPICRSKPRRSPRASTTSLAVRSISRTAVSVRSSTSCSLDRKSTRLNSSHVKISYAVFCLKKKNFHEKFQISTAFDLVCSLNYN